MIQSIPSQGGTANAVTGASNLTTVGAVPYVSASGVLSQDGSITRSTTGQYQLYDSTAVTGNTSLILREGAGQSSNIVSLRGSAGTEFGYLTPYEAKFYNNILAGDYAGFVASEVALTLANNALVRWSSDATRYGTKDTGLSRNAAGIVEANNGTAGTYRDIKFRNRVMTVGGNIASASTIAPTESVHHVTGTTTISTITAPSGFAVSGAGGQITLIPDGLWATNTAGNIALATTAVVSKALIMTYDNATSKWYPSY